MTPETLIKAHQYLYYVLTDTVWTDAKYDAFCREHKIDGNGGSDREDDYTQEVKDCAMALIQERKRKELVWFDKIFKVTHKLPEKCKEVLIEPGVYHSVGVDSGRVYVIYGDNFRTALKKMSK